VAGTFIDMVNRIATELRRSNASTEIKQAINDAIFEAAQNRFYFNEMKDVTFNTVGGTEYYDDLGFVELDAVWYLTGSTRYGIFLVNQEELDALAEGNVTNGPLQLVSHYGGQFRLYPVPSSVVAVHLSGYGKLLPYPLVNDADANAWMTDGEMYIRSLAKRNFLRDVVRDYGEARVYDALSTDMMNILLERTALKSSTGRIKGTQF
jgi:hypothetical protein